MGRREGLILCHAIAQRGDKGWTSRPPLHVLMYNERRCLKRRGERERGAVWGLALFPGCVGGEKTAWYP